MTMRTNSNAQVTVTTPIIFPADKLMRGSSSLLIPRDRCALLVNLVVKFGSKLHLVAMDGWVISLFSTHQFLGMK